MNGSAAQYIPPQFRSTSAEAQAALASPHGQQAAAFISLQNQLTETQTSLSGQLDKIRQLEGELHEHETLKHQLGSMREQMEETKHEMDLFLAGNRGRQFGRIVDDDDDSRSVVTLMDNEDAEERMRDRRRSERENGSRERPRTPEPTMNGDDEHVDVSRSENAVVAQNAQLAERIESLTGEIAEAVQLSQNLQSQHSEAMTAVRLLTERVGVLENGMMSRVAETEQRWEVWRGKFEEGWRKERETWEIERERLRGVVREWEEASRRAHEEDEERELNERLSEDDFIDEEHEEEDEATDDAEEREMMTLNSGWKEGEVLEVRPRKPRRRRPSHKTALAVRALKAVVMDSTGATTPKADSQVLDGSPSPPDRPRVPNRRLGKGKLVRRGSASTFKGEKDSSESGKESGDTLKDSIDAVGPVKLGRRKKQSRAVLQVSRRCKRCETMGGADLTIRSRYRYSRCW